MPVKIGSFEPLTVEEFDALRRGKERSRNPAMDALLDAPRLPDSRSVCP
jgi:hypothetical protein